MHSDGSGKITPWAIACGGRPVQRERSTNPSASTATAAPTTANAPLTKSRRGWPARELSPAPAEGGGVSAMTVPPAAGERGSLTGECAPLPSGRLYQRPRGSLVQNQETYSSVGHPHPAWGKGKGNLGDTP